MTTQLTDALVVSDSDFAEEVKETASNILEYAHEIEFLNHASVGGDCVTLEDMHDGEYARNNCAIATGEVIDQMDRTLNPRDCKLEFGPIMVHHAIHVSDDNGDNAHIIDFTFAQYDEAEEFPLVLPFEEWKERVNYWTAKHFSGATIQKVTLWPRLG